MEKLEKIILPKGRYTGYIWQSDKRQPRIYNNEVVDTEIVCVSSANPFIIEGIIVIRTDNEEVSYSIRYVDGQFIFSHYDLANIKRKKEKEIKNFLASFDKAPGELQFIQCWGEEEDPNCEGMKTLVPQEFVFVGFKKKED